MTVMLYIKGRSGQPLDYPHRICYHSKVSELYKLHTVQKPCYNNNFHIRIFYLSRFPIELTAKTEV